MAPKKIVAIAGNPNSGKTSIFNMLTGESCSVGNWPGVTVERRYGSCLINELSVELVDLPGVYSLVPYALDEKVARDFLLSGVPEAVVDVIDTSNLRRNLYLLTQLLELGIPIIAALNVYDLAKKNGITIDKQKLEELIGIRAVFTNGRTQGGKTKLLEAIEKQLNAPVSPKALRYSDVIEKAIAQIEPLLESVVLTKRRFFAIRLLERDSYLREQLDDDVLEMVDAVVENVETHQKESVKDIIAEKRYAFVNGIYHEAVTESLSAPRHSQTDEIDNWLLHRILGIPIFAVATFLALFFTFKVGDIFSGLLEQFFDLLSSWTGSTLLHFGFSDIVVSFFSEGIISGVGGVLVFLPYLIILFIIIAFLEDSGYMARAAFLIDRVMHIFGLHGRAFLPFLIGFGCNVPAIEATRTIRNAKDRLIVMLAIPFTSCGARFPVYVLITAALFPHSAPFIIFGLYLFSILFSLTIARLLKGVIFPRLSEPFVMELPLYRLPTVRVIWRLTWIRTRAFLKKAGTVILAGSILIWALANLPPGVENISRSLAGTLGRTLTPLFAPLGFDWKAVVALIFGFVAKEIVVSTFGVLYGMQESGLAETLRTAFTPASALAFLMFSLLYTPCVATLAAIYKESGSIKWVVFSVVLSLTLAWIFAFAVKSVWVW